MLPLLFCYTVPASGNGTATAILPPGIWQSPGKRNGGLPGADIGYFRGDMGRVKNRPGETPKRLCYALFCYGFCNGGYWGAVPLPSAL